MQVKTGSNNSGAYSVGATNDGQNIESLNGDNDIDFNGDNNEGNKGAYQEVVDDDQDEEQD